MLFVRRYLILLHPDEGQGTPAPTPEEKKDKKPEEDNVSLAKALKEARENSVSKEDYEKVLEENRRLVSEVINGDGGAGNGQPTPKADIEALRKELYGPNCEGLSNLEFWEKTLELRDAVIEKEGYDPFLPHGAKIKPNDQDIERANAVAKTVRECIEKAEGNSEVFTALLQGETANDSPAFLAHLKKIGVIKK